MTHFHLLPADLSCSCLQHLLVGHEESQEQLHVNAEGWRVSLGLSLARSFVSSTVSPVLAVSYRMSTHFWSCPSLVCSLESDTLFPCAVGGFQFHCPKSLVPRTLIAFIPPYLSVVEPPVHYLSVVKFSTDSSINLSNIFLKPSPFPPVLCVLLCQGLMQSAKEHDTTPVQLSVVNKPTALSLG